jgi:hypothetical protein
MIMRNFSNLAMLLSLAAYPASHAWAADPVSCNAGFTACQIRENAVLQLPFTAFAGDVIVQDPASTTVSDVFRIFNNLVDTGGGTGLGNLAVLYSRDDNMALPDSSTYSANAVLIKEAASGSTSYLGNGTNYSLDTSAVPTMLVYAGDTTADYHDPAQLTAMLTVLGTGAPLPNATVHFTLGSQGCNATTNASGVASCGIVLSQAAANNVVTASFSGIFGADAGTSSSKPFVITLEETTLSYTGDTVIANGGTAHLSGLLLEDNVTPITGRTVTFTLGAGGTAQTCNGVSDATGKAVCTISPVTQPLGSVAVGDSFAGDAFYRPASASTSTVLFAFLTQGGFVFGDQSAQPGTDQTFWSAQWTAANRLSGGGAPDSFKGFAENLSSDPPKCGATWTSKTANSSNPPTSVPAYMGVLVTPSVTKSGATLSGIVTSIVIVKTDPGYSGDPGHSGTGMIVAQFCH